MKIAVLTTAWHSLSHADVIVSRWVKPFFTDAQFGWTTPPSTIASAFIEQTPASDIGREFCTRHAIPIFPTIEGALTLGTGRLAVDGVLLIGEHGDYPLNEFRQKLYPRKRFFDAIVEVFRASGRGVPVFNDKHFSWDFQESREMLDAAKQLGFPLYGGSSLPHFPCIPTPPPLEGRKTSEALGLFYDSLEAYGYHSIELVQSFLEKRGERGIRAVRAIEGSLARDAIASAEVPPDLLRAALACHGYPNEDGLIPFLLDRVDCPVVFQLEHADGLRANHVFLPKFVQNFVVALRLDANTLHACQVGPGGVNAFFPHFATLNARLETFFRTGQPPGNPLRTHLTAGALQAALQALPTQGQWQSTPWLQITY